MARTTTKANNEAYVRGVTTALRGLHRATLISVGTAMFREGLRMTWQDSGQAAYNWHMGAKQEPRKPAMTQHNTKSVGARGEKRSINGLEALVIGQKFIDYGVGPEEYPATSSHLVSVVGDPTERAAAKVKTVVVYNPIYDLSSEEHKVHAVRAFYQGRTRTVDEAIEAARDRQIAYLQTQVKAKRMKLPGFFTFLSRFFTGLKGLTGIS